MAGSAAAGEGTPLAPRCQAGALVGVVNAVGAQMAFTSQSTCPPGFVSVGSQRLRAAPFSWKLASL